MEKSLIQYLSPYLPYGLNVLWLEETQEDVFTTSSGVPMEMTADNIIHFCTHNNSTKPLFMPLSELTVDVMKEIYSDVNAPEHMPGYCDCDTIGFNGKEFTHTFEGDISYDGGYEFERTTQRLDNQYELITGLFKRHYDYFNLIEKGLALNKLTFMPC